VVCPQETALSLRRAFLPGVLLGAFGLGQELLDLQIDLAELFAGPLVTDRTVSAGVGEDLRAVDGHGDVAHPQLLATRGQLEDLRECISEQRTFFCRRNAQRVSWSGCMSAQR